MKIGGIYEKNLVFTLPTWRISSFFIDKSCVALGWDKLAEDLSHKTTQAIKKDLLKAYPERETAINIWASYFEKFIHKIQIGDMVLTYNSTERNYLLGEITGQYQYAPKMSFIGQTWPHIRKTQWTSKPISRDILSQNTKNSLGTTLTLSELQPEQTKEILSLINNQPEKVVEQAQNIKEENAVIIDEARERLKDRIMELDPDQMEKLLKEILNAMGYIAEQTPKGPDRALDVFASKDGLGLEDPRICVEVKHRNGKMGSKEIRQFLGSRKEYDRCIFVSTGGFTKDARYEAERSTIPLTLLDIDRLADIIERYYDNFSAEGKILLPLKKTYLPL